MTARRPFRFTTRTLFAATTLLGVLFALFGVRAVREGRERSAKAEIKRLGGRFETQNAKLLARDGWPSRWMTFLLYEDSARVTHVSLDGTAVRDDDFATLTSLPRLEGLDISRTEVTDAALAQLARIPTLKYVNAHNTNITESGVHELQTRHPGLVLDWR